MKVIGGAFQTIGNHHLSGLKNAARISLIALCAVASTHADTLYDNSNFTTGIGNGFNGANTSVLGPGNPTYGWEVNSATATNLVADDFVLSTQADVEAIIVYAYNSNASQPYPPVFPFAGVTVSIWNTSPGMAGSVLAMSTTVGSAEWTGIYRVSDSNLPAPSGPSSPSRCRLPISPSARARTGPRLRSRG